MVDESISFKVYSLLRKYDASPNLLYFVIVTGLVME